MKKLNLVGLMFGRLTVLAEAGRDSRGRVLWSCLCVCGTKSKVRTCSLRCGYTNSCGCLMREKAAAIAPSIGRLFCRTHGHSNQRGGLKSRTYQSWQAMLQRCTNPGNTKYHRYGGAGVMVCERWQQSFENFLTDMGERLDGTTLSRFADSGNYEPGNCAWHTPAQQGLEQRRSHATRG